MNIYVLDTNPELAAQAHCDGDLVIGIHTCGVLLSTAHNLCDAFVGDDWLLPLKEPCGLSKWVARSKAHYKWVYALMAHLAVEHEHRFGVRHATWCDMGSVLRDLPHNIAAGSGTFWLDVPHMYRGDKGVVTPVQVVSAYRRFYRAERMMGWTNRAVPVWART